MAMLSPTVSRLRIQLTSAVISESMARLADPPGVEGGRLRVLVLQVAGGTDDAYVEDVRRWGEVRSSKHVEDGLERSDVKLIVSASTPPRSFLSE
ncbi:hypothetical protein L210DRAFT_978269 [Boletus edulis BED1]|uniref:Uncharacterized protein n=1 Tax=Boletus edulis BED1 TaxID=1328754 RepID=A0AAD4G5R3_BOLED|nr:hypothetical protein L210DRAFT_978269 [Boletus edulis BED1]